jgi:hypothetical protein
MQGINNTHITNKLKNFVGAEITYKIFIKLNCGNGGL